MPSRSRENGYRAPALEKGIAILELLANARRPLAVADIAATLNRSRAEIYRMLVVLESLEYMHRTGDGRYDLTTKLFDIASRHAPKRTVIAAARAVMEELAEATLQSCHLVVASGDHMVCIAREESPAAIGFSVQVGFRPPMLQSTSGRVYFAFQDPARQQLLAARLRRGSGDAAVREFLASAAAIARRGYAVEPSRLTTGIEDLSAPVLDPHTGQAIACLTVPFISHRLFPMTLKQTVRALLDAALRISRNLKAAGGVERNREPWEKQRKREPWEKQRNREPSEKQRARAQSGPKRRRAATTSSAPRNRRPGTRGRK